MITLHDTNARMIADPEHWLIHFMNFVDDFRSRKDVRAIETPFEVPHERFSALLASTAEYLCRELGLAVPSWLSTIPAVRTPWFVSGMESLKAIAFVESPLPFRLRKILVLENFLSRA
jgi:hypothetical protein